MSERGEEQRSGYGQAMRLLGITGGLGLEMALLVVGGAFLGSHLEERFELGTWVVVACVVVSLLIFGMHIRYLVTGKGEAEAREQER